MSAPSTGPTWQRPEVVGAFLSERETLMPMLGVQEDLISHLLARHAHPVARFLDIGAGDGAAAELVLAQHPTAEAVLVDFSEPMLAQAGRRLDALQARWQAA